MKDILPPYMTHCLTLMDNDRPRGGSLVTTVTLKTHCLASVLAQESLMSLECAASLPLLQTDAVWELHSHLLFSLADLFISMCLYLSLYESLWLLLSALLHYPSFLLPIMAIAMESVLWVRANIMPITKTFK